jgi:hypothetical protein
MKKILTFIAFTCVIVPSVTFAGVFDFQFPTFGSGGGIDTLDPWKVVSGYITPRNSLNGLQIPQLGGSGTVCLHTDNNGKVGKASADCGTGSGGGGGAGAFSTTTSSVSSQLNAYPYQNTMNVLVGSSSTTTAPFWFSPTTVKAYLKNLIISTSTGATSAYLNFATSTSITTPTGDSGYGFKYNGASSTMEMKNPYGFWGQLATPQIDNQRMYQLPNTFKRIRAGSFLRYGTIGDSVAGDAYYPTLQMLNSMLGSTVDANGGIFPGGAIVQNSYDSSGTATISGANTYWWQPIASLGVGTTDRWFGGAGTGDITSDTFTVYYVKEPSAGTFKIQTNDTSAGWVDQAGYTSVNCADTATSSAAATFTKTLSTYQLRVVGVTGSCRIISGGLWDSTAKGVRMTDLSMGGIAFDSIMTGTQANVRNPIIQDLGLDLLILQFRDDADYIRTYLPQFEAMMATYSPNTDVIYMGVAPLEEPSNQASSIQQNLEMQRLANIYNRPYFDGYNIFVNKDVGVANGFLNAAPNVHLTATGADYEGWQLFKAMGINNMEQLNPGYMQGGTIVNLNTTNLTPVSGTNVNINGTINSLGSLAGIKLSDRTNGTTKSWDIFTNLRALNFYLEGGTNATIFEMWTNGFGGYAFRPYSTFSGGPDLGGASNLWNNIYGNKLITPYASTTAISVSGLTSGNCVQVGTGGLLTTTGSACGSGSGGGGSIGWASTTDVQSINTTGTGNVGIGTTSPWRKLSVSGSSDLGVNALAGSFTATSTDTNWFMGNVAIGTTTADKNLNVYNASGKGQIVVGGSTGGALFVSQGASEATGGFTVGYTNPCLGNFRAIPSAISCTNALFYYNTSTGDTMINNTFGGSSVIGLNYQGVRAVTIPSSLNVGIGTTSPYAKLAVAGQTVSAYFTATTTTASTFPYASTTAISVSGLTSGNCVQAGTGGLLTTTGSACGSGGGGGIGWASTTLDVNSIYSVGTKNVGIGSSTPSSKLAIVGVDGTPATPVGGDAPDALTVTGGVGGLGNLTGDTGGIGGGITIVAGVGGHSDGTGVAGAGGTTTIKGGDGGSGELSGGNGGNVLISGGTGNSGGRNGYVLLNSITTIGPTASLAVLENIIATSTSITIDWGASNKQTVRIGTSATTITFSNAQLGQTVSLLVCNGGATAGTITWSGSFSWPGGIVPGQTTTAKQCDKWSFDYMSGTSTAKYFLSGLVSGYK